MLGYVFKLTGGAILWSSSKQSAITSSTMYAEFVTCYKTMGQTTWLKKFVSGLKSCLFLLLSCLFQLKN
jgi:hypothetical protein